VVFQLFTMVFATILAWTAGNSGASFWAASHFLKVAGNTLLTVVMLGIWFLPVWGWLFLASVWAKRAPFLWAVLPLVTIMIGEAWTLNTAHFAEMIGHYLGLGGHIAGASTAAIWLASESHAVTHNGIEFSHPLQALGTPEFWYGVILAGIFVTVSIYIRRYRDEA
jgi:ABC-2 type transport system permease protein